MVRRTAGLFAFTLVTVSFAEQGLRGLSHAQVPLVLERIEQAPQDLLHRIEQAPQDSGLWTPDEVMGNTDHKDVAVMNTLEIFMFFMIWFALYVPIATYYFIYVRWHVEDFTNEAMEHKMIKHGSDGEGSLDHFSSGLFNCRKRPEITFWSCCCPGIRWADTMHKLGIHRFWGGFWILTTLYFISFIPKATIICQLLVVMYMTYHRQVLRKAFAFEEQGGATWVLDCFTYMCCMCCAVAQEARHTRLACTINHQAIQKWEEEEAEEHENAKKLTGL